MQQKLLILGHLMYGICIAFVPVVVQVRVQTHAATNREKHDKYCIQFTYVSYRFRRRYRCKLAMQQHGAKYMHLKRRSMSVWVTRGRYGTVFLLLG